MRFAQHLSWRTGLHPVNLAIVCFSWLTPPAVADPPSLSHFYPAGGQRGATTVTTCAGKFSWPVKVWSSAAEVTATDEPGKLAIKIHDDLHADRIWIRLYNDEGASTAIPFLIGDLPETGEVEPNDVPAGPQSLADFSTPDDGVQVTVNGVLQKNGDVDGFAVDLKTGQTLVAAVAANTPFGSPMDAILQVASPDGTVLAENHDDVGLDPRLAFTASRNGRYLVRVFAFPSAPNQSIRFHGGKNYVYRLTLTTGPYLTHTIPMSVPLAGGDHVEAFGWNLPPQVALEPKPLFTSVEVEPSGVVKTSASRVVLVRPNDIAGTVRLRGLPKDLDSAIARTSEQQPQTIPSPITVSGWLDQPRKTDFFDLPMKKDQQWSIAVESQSLRSPLVPLIKLLDPDGNVAGEAGVSGAAQDVSITHKAALDGNYRLTVCDRYGDGGPRHIYRLTVDHPKTDFELALATDAIVLTPDNPFEIPVTVKRYSGDGPAIDAISITAIDLPPGITCVPAVSAADGETASKVALKLETDGTPVSGTIQIRGTATGDGTERIARTPPKFDACFDRLWLTVPGKKN